MRRDYTSVPLGRLYKVNGYLFITNVVHSFRQGREELIYRTYEVTGDCEEWAFDSKIHFTRGRVQSYIDHK